jgi:hypothetical protein
MAEVNVATAYSLAATGEMAAEEICSILASRLKGEISLLTVFATESLAHDGIVDALSSRLPGVPIFGGTTCRGVITEDGVHIGRPGAVGVLALSDSQGAYSSGSAKIRDDARSTAREALEAALERAGRAYESPALIWTCQPPGMEEQVLAGFEDVVGPDCPIMGGSSADEAIAGRWRQFSSHGVGENVVTVAVLFPSAPIGLAFKSGYAPTKSCGIVTKSSARRLIEIDGLSAARKYADWTGDRIDPSAPGVILQQSTFAPLARRVGTYAGVDEYLLSHPATIESDGAITLFTEINEGEVLHVMSGGRESLIERAGRVVKDARGSLPAPGSAISGGLIIYCAGCMLASSDDLDAVAAGIKAAFGEAPFLVAFTFGEQGALISSGNRHGNLMIATTVFARCKT